MRRLLLLSLLLSFSSSAQATVDRTTHKKCLQAKDYLGCVKAHSVDSGLKEVITNPGTATANGNACPIGYAYIGQGYCREVLCTWMGKNSTVLGGKKWKCPPSGIDGFSLAFGAQSRIGNDPACSSGEPEIGWTSTCEAPYKEPPKSKRTEGRRISGWNNQNPGFLLPK